MHFSEKWEKRDAKARHDKVDLDSGATGPDRRSGSNRADRRHHKIADSESGRTTTAGSPDRPPSAARRSSAFREKPDRPERSTEQGKRRARQEDQEHLPRLLNLAASIRRCARRA